MTAVLVDFEDQIKKLSGMAVVESLAFSVGTRPADVRSRQFSPGQQPGWCISHAPRSDTVVSAYGQNAHIFHGVMDNTDADDREFLSLLS